MKRLISTVQEVRAHIAAERKLGKKIHLVPTMGALHTGHLTLIQQASAPDTMVYVSIFINPLQFDDDTDFARYPRTIETDVQLAFEAGAGVVFAPSVEEMYPRNPRTTVQPGALGGELEGAVREAHFSGMLTIVVKLLNIISPDKVYFGEKDYQQLILVRHMVQDFYMPIDVVGVPTVREKSGLAMSSRNRFLSVSEAKIAPELYTALCLGAAIAEQGAEFVVQTVVEYLNKFPEFSIDYFELRDETLDYAKPNAPARLLIAAHLGEVRLIDNIIVPQLG